MTLTSAARALLDSAAHAHLVTIGPDGAPRIAVVWVGLEGEEIVAAHLSADQQKLHNIRRDPRVALSIESERLSHRLARVPRRPRPRPRHRRGSASAAAAAGSHLSRA